METLFAEYVALRASGTRPAAALEVLRERIETMQPTDKLSLVRAVKHYEEQSHNATSQFRPPSSMAPALFDDEEPSVPSLDDLAAKAAQNGESTVKLPENLRKQHESAARGQQGVLNDVEEYADVVTCPNCGNLVGVHLLQCPTCYYVMPAAGEPVEVPAEPVEQAVSDTSYGTNSTLVLTSRDGRRLHARPQDRLRETIVGRTDGKTFTADLDLSPLGASDLGVSRVHSALVYDAQRGVLTVMDMNSMNGTFLNGLRLHPQELHDLRPGDHLRLGRLSLRVSYTTR